jgi:hypothetical protein
MDEHLGPAQGVGAGDFGIDDLFAGNCREVSDLGSGDRKHAVDPINVEVFGPHVVRGRREHRVEATIAQDDISRRRDDEARLEIKTWKMGIDLIGIAREEQALRYGDRAKRRIFWAIDGERGLVGEFSDANPPGKACQQIFGQDDEAQGSTAELLDEDPRRRQLRSDMGNVGKHLRPRRHPVSAAIDRSGGKLEGERGVGHRSVAMRGWVSIPSG